MVRLLDSGLERLKNMTLDMAKHSEETVSAAIDAYVHGKDLRKNILERSEVLRMLQDQVSELAIELIARYQPVASDLRYIRSCMEIAYGFSRFGRYAYDISQVLGIFGGLSMCDRAPVQEAGDQAKRMIRLSIEAFTKKDVNLAEKLREMDDIVDRVYLDFLKGAAQTVEADPKCLLSTVLILRYLERIADHATYVGDSVKYIVSGERTARK